MSAIVRPWRFHVSVAAEASWRRIRKIACMNPDNILAAPAHADPYPWYASLVAGPGLVFEASSHLWIAARAAVVSEVLANPACRVRPPAEQIPRALAGTLAGGVFGDLVRMNDGEKHHAPRLALQAFLARMNLDQVWARARLVGAAAAAGASNPGDALAGENPPFTAARLSCPGLSKWIHDVPVMTLAGLLGFPEAACPRVAHWTAAFVAGISPLGDPAAVSAASVAADALLARFAELVRAAQAQPDSALAALQAEALRAGWSDMRGLLANLVGLLSQTFEATAGLLGNSIVALATRPELLAMLTNQPSACLSVVHEVSRFDPSIHNTRRFVARATTVAGTRLGAGDTVLLVLGAAGRDPRCNPQPDRFWLDRPDRVVPGFGDGVHQCPGRAVACAIAAGALEGWLRHTGSDRLALPARWYYRPLPNARIPVFEDFAGKKGLS